MLGEYGACIANHIDQVLLYVSVPFPDVWAHIDHKSDANQRLGGKESRFSFSRLHLLEDYVTNLWIRRWNEFHPCIRTHFRALAWWKRPNHFLIWSSYFSRPGFIGRFDRGKCASRTAFYFKPSLWVSSWPRVPSFIIPIKSDRIFAGWPSHSGVHIVHCTLHYAHYICRSQNGHIGGNSVNGHILVLWIQFSLSLKVVVLTYEEIQVNIILDTNDETELVDKIFSTQLTIFKQSEKKVSTPL